MKQATTIIILIIINIQSLNAQIKNLHRQSNKISDSLVINKLIGNTAIKHVDEKNMKEGWNVFSHQPGRFIYVDYKNGVVRGFYTSDTSGKVMAGIFFGQGSSSYQCTVPVCGCRGDKECETLFSSDECKENLVCIGKTCMCTRPYDTKEVIKDMNKVKSPKG
jgi:hypothetical protein